MIKKENKMTQEEVKKQIATVPPQQTLQQLIEKSAKEFKKALPIHMRPERLVRIALTCIRQNSELTQCTPASFVGALLVSAQLGLEPMAGRAYILPFFNNKTGRKDAQFIVGYKGLAELFYRHEKSVQINWGVVHKNDEFDYEYGTQAKLRHKPAMNDKGETIGYYVIAEVQGGAMPFMYMSKEDCIEHGKKHSKTYDQKTQQFYSSSPWAREPDAMCLKTVLIQLAKLLPLSIELQRAISADETSREYREGIDDALDIPAASWSNGEVGPVETPQLTQEPPAVATNGTAIPINKGTMTKKQDTAIRELAKKVYGEKCALKIIERVGSQFGVETLAELSTEQAAILIRELSKEKADV
jgi:recombination protein RecT